MSTPVEHSDFNFWSPQYHTTEKTREQRWRSDESARLPPMLTWVWGLPQQEGSEKYKKSLYSRPVNQFGPADSILALCHMWVEFPVGSRLAAIVFLRVLRFSYLHVRWKPTSPNFNSTRMEDPHENNLTLMLLPRWLIWRCDYINLFFIYSSVTLGLAVSGIFQFLLWLMSIYSSLHIV